MNQVVSALSSAVPPAPNRAALLAERRRAGLLLATPAAILLLCLSLGPSAWVIVLSFTDYRLGVSALNFVGLDNYAELARDPNFWNSLRNTAIYVAVVVPGAVLTGLGAALLIESRSRLRQFYRVSYFMPVAGTLVALATAWEVILHPSFGLANLMLEGLGLSRMRFLSDPDMALLTLAGIGIWELVGFNMVLFLAGLSTIPRDLYEAAAIDGAQGGLDRFRLVTWPMLGPVTMFVIVLTAIRAFRVFETVAVLTQGGPNRSTDVLIYTLFTEGFRYFRTGYASAIAVVFLLVTVTLTLLQTRVFDRRVSYQR